MSVTIAEGVHGPALDGLSLPGLLVLTPEEPPEAALIGGSETVLRVTVENRGDAAIGAGTATLRSGQDPDTETDRLVLLDPAEQALPALGPGESAELAWRVRLPAVGVPELVGFEVIANGGDDEYARETGSVRVEPE